MGLDFILVVGFIPVFNLDIDSSMINNRTFCAVALLDYNELKSSAACRIFGLVLVPVTLQDGRKLLNGY